MKLLKGFLVVLLAFSAGAIYGHMSHDNWWHEDSVFRASLLVSENNRLSSGNIEEQIELNDIEIDGALGGWLERQEQGEFYWLQNKFSLQFYLSSLKDILLVSDPSRAESLERSLDQVVKYHQSKKLDFSHYFSCDEDTKENSDFNCYLYKQSAIRRNLIQSYVIKSE